MKVWKYESIEVWKYGGTELMGGEDGHFLWAELAQQEHRKSEEHLFWRLWRLYTSTE